MLCLVLGGLDVKTCDADIYSFLSCLSFLWNLFLGAAIEFVFKRLIFNDLSVVFEKNDLVFNPSIQIQATTLFHPVLNPISPA